MPATPSDFATAALDLVARHAQAQDEGRATDIAALYTDDGVLDIPGREPVRGRTALVAAFEQWAPTRAQKHLVSNTVVDTDDTGRLRATSDVVFFAHGKSGWTARMVGRYVDLFVESDGALRLARRTATRRAIES